ncbi:hypothetical protein M427DRAFT_489261 [Gonapodya prolifera JEL478]|uniref:Uncharacterized protein n=1 Tax=Gonapodya prolifera (strain JEL478) TaxID=1344416 RepID=A0A139ANU8_GONPJ|nr:hypothetical protein M427DRAFT_489261 [Gonapodya prolifera JEL478]|eukprot:KXS18412.1 hypothetical protein M427DRAFT_489261 [Gonapodya prolifera JEL478]
MAAFWNIGFTHDSSGTGRRLLGTTLTDTPDHSSDFLSSDIDDSPLSPGSEHEHDDDDDDLDLTDHTAVHSPNLGALTSKLPSTTQALNPLHLAFPSASAHAHPASKALASLGTLATTVSRQSSTVLLQQKHIGTLLTECHHLREAAASAQSDADALRTALDRKAHESESLRMDIDRRNKWIEHLLAQISEMQNGAGAGAGGSKDPAGAGQDGLDHDHDRDHDNEIDPDDPTPAHTSGSAPLPGFTHAAIAYPSPLSPFAPTSPSRRSSSSHIDFSRRALSPGPHPRSRSALKIDTTPRHSREPTLDGGAASASACTSVAASASHLAPGGGGGGKGAPQPSPLSMHRRDSSMSMSGSRSHSLGPKRLRRSAAPGQGPSPVSPASTSAQQQTQTQTQQQAKSAEGPAA